MSGHIAVDWADYDIIVEQAGNMAAHAGSANTQWQRDFARDVEYRLHSLAERMSAALGPRSADSERWERVTPPQRPRLIP